VARNGWFDEERAETTKNKNEVYSKMIQRHRTRRPEEGYKEMRRKKRIHRKKNKEYYEEQMKQVEKLHGQKESRRMYRLVNCFRKEFKPYMTVCRNSTVMILSEPFEIMERWRQYFQNLLTDFDTTSTDISQELGEGSENEREEIEQ
jgi:hypothetical protein